MNKKLKEKYKFLIKFHKEEAKRYKKLLKSLKNT